jgi:hypothetical protein
MKYKGIYDSVRELVFFVDEDSDEEGVGTGVVHFGYTEEGGRGVEDGNFRSGEDRGKDCRLFQSAALLGKKLSVQYNAERNEG